MGNKVVIVGGGASGLLAAITAARKGSFVVVLEKNDRVGKKILSTGNGRCNYTNIYCKVSNYNSDFVFDVLKKFSPEVAISFFKDIGMLSKIEDEGRVYPLSMQASTVLDVLRAEAHRLGVFVKVGFEVKKIEKNDNLFRVYSSDNEVIQADKVIVCTGGIAAPKTGSNGSGYDLLKALGHSVTALKPSLCHVLVNKGVHGVRQYAKVSVSDKISDIGEIQFNKDSISGIPVLNISKYVQVGDFITLDFLPEISFDEVYDLLKTRPAQSMETFLIGILNKNLSYAILKDIGLSPLSRMSDSLSDDELRLIARALKGWKVTVSGFANWDNAQVTSGGINLGEIDSTTLESKIVKGLYITGELCDIDSKCGGYNLHWAWASGFVAGSEASECTE